MTQLLGPLVTDGQHLRTELDSRDLDVLRVKRQVSRRAAGQLEDPSTGLRADPSPPVAELDALEKSNLAVVT
ncbi:MAG: hypothetical protein AABM43_09625 [Actinomycetota bacterium]